MTQLMPTPMSNLRLFVAFCESGGIDRRAGLILTAAIVDSVAPASCVSDQIAAGEIVPFMQKLRQLGTTLLLDHVAKPITGQSSAPPRAYGSSAARVAELIGSSKKTVSLSQLRQSRRVESADFGRWRVPDAVGNLPGKGVDA